MILDTAPAFLGRNKLLFTLIGAVLAIALFIARVESNPPGFHLDESSISYNAYSISQTGRDEHGALLPVFFQAFGDYKNPVYVYLLAGVFKLTGPSILVARLLSSAGGLLTAFLLGVLAARISGRHAVAVIVGISSLLTPWLFETSRLVMEVALYPLVLTLFLFCLHQVSRKERWSYLDVVSLAITLALLTYTYSIGRLLGPLFALGLVLFATRLRWPSIIKTWCTYVVTLIPLILFNRLHPDSLTARFRAITYLKSEAGFDETILRLASHLAGHLNPWRLLLFGEPNPDILINGHMLVATVVFALIGGCYVFRFNRREAWWWFIFYGLLGSLIPAALTTEYFHLLRLIPVPVFLLVLSVPGIAWLLELAQRRRSWRIAFTGLIVLLLVQAAFFQSQFHASAKTAKRMHQFDAGFPERILSPALAASSRIYLVDSLVPGYIQTYWYTTLKGIDRSRFVLLPPSEPYPQNAVVITTEERCRMCRLISSSEPYAVYVTTQPGRQSSPLSSEGFRAELHVLVVPASLRAGSKETIRVRVRNKSGEVWLAPDRSGAPYQVSLGNHWLDTQGQIIISDDGRTTLREDVRPGEEIELPLVVNTPWRPGAYILEIDMLQEDVAWFGPKGSPTLKLPVKIE